MNKNMTTIISNQNRRRRMMASPAGRAFLIENGYARRPQGLRASRECPACHMPKATCVCVPLGDEQDGSR